MVSRSPRVFGFGDFGVVEVLMLASQGAEAPPHLLCGKTVAVDVAVLTVLMSDCCYFCRHRLVDELEI